MSAKPGGPVTALAHVAIATPDADALAATLAAALGAERGAEEMLDGGALRVVFLRLGPLTLERCRASGVQLIDEQPRPGAHGTRVAFLHPKSLGGVLLELCESPPTARRPR